MKTPQKKLKKRKVTLDGLLGGSKLNGSVEIRDSEAAIVRRVLLKAGGIQDGDKMYVNVYGLNEESGLEVSLTRDHRKDNIYFLNIRGNPVAFLTGENTYGFPEADRLIVASFIRAIKQIETSCKLEIPSRIKDQIRALNIYLHTLEFATYTNKIKNKKQLLLDMATAYRIGHSVEKDENGINQTETLLDMLDLEMRRKHKTHKSSVCLRILSASGEEQAMFQAYDKEQQLLDANERRAVAGESLLEVPKDIKNRIRFDLNLNYGWFRSHRIDGRKIQTLADLRDYVEKNYDGKWHAWLKVEFDWALHRTLMLHMWSFDYKKVMAGELPEFKTLGKDGKEREANKLVTRRVYMALMRARTLKELDDQEFAKLWDSRALDTKLNLNPHPYKMELDMGLV